MYRFEIRNKKSKKWESMGRKLILNKKIALAWADSVNNLPNGKFIVRTIKVKHRKK